MRTTVRGVALSVQTCARRLAPHGVEVVDLPGPGQVVLAWPGALDREADIDCEISWWGPARPPGEPGSEALVQAACGLMHLHGRDLPGPERPTGAGDTGPERPTGAGDTGPDSVYVAGEGGPRRIGIEICSVAAGMLAAQALLAAAVGRCRGAEVADVRTSVLQAGLLQASHYLAASTCPPEEVPTPAPAPGPPFRTADARWFEIETFDTEAWKAFWLHLGAPAADLGPAWTRFRPRYYRGTSSLPFGFHEATASHTLAEALAAARASGVSLSPVRSYAEVLADGRPLGGHPLVVPLMVDHGDPHGGRPRSERVTDGAAPADPAAHRPDTSAESGTRLSTTTGLPLAGIEVVEATSRLQGPLAGLLLQMLGARVTRVEAPGGDVGRGVPPLADDVGSFFLCFNRGKDTVEIDLGKSRGRIELAERAAAADVFLHNWRPGKATEWGLAPEDLVRANPRLVCAEASGWSAGSPAARLIGTDFLVQAWTGLGHALHPDPDPPRPTRVLLTDFMGALVTCEGVLAGLYRREVHGHGCRVATSLEAGGMALQAHVLDGVAAGEEDGRAGGRPVWGPLDVPVRAGDGWLAIDATEADLPALCALCDVEPGDRARADLEGEVARCIAGAPVDEWVRRLDAAGVGCAPVVTDLATLVADPVLASLFEPLASTCRAPASPWLQGP